MKQQAEEPSSSSSSSSLSSSRRRRRPPPSSMDNPISGNSNYSNNYNNNLSVLSHVEKSVARGGGGENAEEPRDGVGQESVIVEKREDYSAVCKWTITQFSRVKARALWSRYFEVGGYDCRLLVYPRGDSQALPGYLSIYLQVMDPRGSSSSKWDCFASYRLCVVNQCDETKSVQKDSWHRFSGKKKSHGWCDFTQNAAIMDPKAGFVVNDAVLITAEILVLHESVSFSRDNELQSIASPMPEVLSGKFTWKVHNFSLFKEMIKTQKIMSPIFPAGECNLRLSVYQSSVNGVEYLSMCLESKDTEKSVASLERSCWCLFRMSVLNQRPGMNHMHRDSYGRFAADSKSGDNTSLGWNDYMQMTDFVSPEMGFLFDDTSVFSTSFHVIKESSGFTRSLGGRSYTKKADGHQGRFSWRIENFTRLKDILKKRKITGLCVKSRRFQVGNHDCRLIVYPRGQSQPPCHLSMFLEVTDARNNSAEWSCFVSHRLSVMNQRYEERSVTKESQNRYSKTAKDWGWREFVTLTSLFDQDSGFLVQDTVIFSAEVLILKEISTMQNCQDYEVDYNASGSQSGRNMSRATFTWKVENFLAFKEIMETRKIFSKFFQADGCELRIGVYESFDTLCIYLESDQSVGTDPDKNFWVRYRMAVVNQKHPNKTVWKESSICTKTWNNSVLQFMKVFDMLDPEAGFLIRDTVVFVCEILDCCPWFEFSDLEVMVSDNEQDALSTDPDELIDSDGSEGTNGDEEDIFRSFLARAGFHLTYGDNPPLLLDPSQLQTKLRELLLDAGAIAGFLTGLRVYLNDPVKVKQLLLPTKLMSPTFGNPSGNKVETLSPSLMNLLMGVKVLQQAIVDLLLDIMVECCQTSEGKNNGISGSRSKDILDATVASISRTDLKLWDSAGTIGSAHSTTHQRQDINFDNTLQMQAVRDGNLLATQVDQNTAILPGFLASESGAQYPSPVNNANQMMKPKCEQSYELLRLIVNSLRALDGAVSHGCLEPRRQPESAQKFAFVLENSPRHLKEDLIALAPKLVDVSEYQITAFVLLAQLRKTDSEPALLLPVLNVLNQLEIGSEVWEQVLCQVLGMLTVFNDDTLAAVIGSVFKAATQCQQVPQAAKAVHDRLKVLGANVSPPVLDCLRRTVASQEDVAEALLSEIDSDFEKGELDFIEPTAKAAVAVKESKGAASQLQFTADQVATACSQIADVYILVELLSLHSLRIETQNVFERAIAQGVIDESSMVMFLERWHAHKPSIDYRCCGFGSQSSESIVCKSLPEGHEDFLAVLGLAEALTLSKNTRVKKFVSRLYAVMFKVYKNEVYREQMLRGLVEGTATNTNGYHEMDLCMDILSFLVQEEGAGRPVLLLLRELAQVATSDRTALQRQLRTSEEEIIRASEHRQDEITSLSKEKALLSKKLTDAVVAQTQIKSEMKAEMDRFAREKRDLSERLQEAENQLEWIRSEHAEEIAKLAAEKKVFQDHLRDAETQLTQLKSRKRDELKRVVKEKNALAERLKNAESARKRFDEELKRFATETVSREELRQSLEDEVQRLKQTVGQTEGGLREKEEHIKGCETYIHGMEAKLDACQRSQITSMFGAEKLWAKGFTGSKIKMAIFDTGIRADHPHFRNIKERTNWTNEDSLNDNLGHGTFVAGVIASQDMECLGFSPDSEIYAFRVFTDAQVSYTSWFLDAFNYAIATGINVLNLSIGGPDYLDRPFVEKVWEITANKIIMVSAIGNDGPLYGTLNNPADQNDVIGVGGIDYDDHIASFSSRGMSTWEIPHGYGRVKPDIVAYGRDIMGSKTSTGCKSLSGTSVASPVVAGVVCLLASVIPENIRWDILNPASMKQTLVEGAAKLGGPNMFEQGAGRLDLLESYEILLKYRPRASIVPSILDFTDCPYVWPFCRQPLYAGAMPVMFNATILNGMGVTGHLESEPTWHPFNEVGNLLNIHFTYSDVIWPWTGYLALHMQIKDEGAQFSGLIEGNVTFIVVSPPAKGENTPRRSICILVLKLQVIPTPPRSQRILWDQFHSIRYPPGYIPRDSLDVKNDILDWHGDHPHTNFHGMFDMLRDAGYYIEILGSPLTCFDASRYGTLLMVDLEDEFFKEEIDKLEKDVKVHGLGLVVFGDWYNVETMVKMRFFDDNTRSWWTPATGGANIPALNDLLKPFGIAFGDTILNGAFFLAGERSHYASGTDIAEFPAGGFVHNFSFQDNFDGSTSQKVVQASGLAKVESSVLGVLEVDGGTGRIAVYGDSNCLDSSHMVINCYWLLRKLLGFTSQNIQDPLIFSTSNRLASQLIRNEASFPARREDVNLSSYSLVINHNLMCGNDARFEVWGAKGYDAETWKNIKFPGIPSPFIIRQPMRSNPDTSQSMISARPAIGNAESNLTAEEETSRSEKYRFNATKDGFVIGQSQGLEQVGNHSLKIPLQKGNISINISSRRHRAKMDLLGWLNRDELDVPTLVTVQWLVPVLLCITGFLLGLSFWRMRQRRRRRARKGTVRPIFL